MSDQITITGLVATHPRHIRTSEGLDITSFRLASAQRRFDRGQDRWIDGDTNWYTITSFRQLAVNVAGSVEKGQRVVLSGRLRIREWENGERTGTNVDIDADAVGHDLAWGTSTFTRVISSSSSTKQVDGAGQAGGAGQVDTAEHADGAAAETFPDGPDASADNTAEPAGQSAVLEDAQAETAALPF